MTLCVMWFEWERKLAKQSEEEKRGRKEATQNVEILKAGYGCG